MAQRLKRWESPRREGRNDKGKGGSARQRQRRKQFQALRKKLKEQSDNQNKKWGGNNASPFFWAGSCTDAGRSLCRLVNTDDRCAISKVGFCFSTQPTRLAIVLDFGESFMEINWQELAERVESTTEVEPLLGTRFPTFPPMRALEIMLGEDFFKSAVDQYIDGKPEAEFAQDILALVRSSIAMKCCYSIYKESESSNRRIEALELLRWTANERIIEWIPEFLDSSDSDIQNMAVAIIDQMLFNKIIDYDDLQPILESALQQPRSDYVRQRIQSFIDAESYCLES